MGQKEDQETYMSSKKKRKNELKKQGSGTHFPFVQVSRLTAYSCLPHLQKTKQKKNRVDEEKRIVKLKTRDARLGHNGRRKR